MIIEPRFSPDQSRQINDFTADGILAKDSRGTAGTTSGRRHGIESNRCEIEVRDSGNYCTIAERRAVYRARDQLEKEQV